MLRQCYFRGNGAGYSGCLSHACDGQSGRLWCFLRVQDGSVIRGQNEISHPAVRDSPCQLPTSRSHLAVDKVRLQAMP